MKDQEEPASINQNLEPICEECKKNSSKYKCPGCYVRTCSLACVKAHKQRMGCSGKRNVTQFVPISQFNDNILISDYNLLEDTKRVTESAQRFRDKLCAYSYFKLPHYLQSLRSAAASRRTKLLFLPGGMTKRENNQTRYDRRRKFISWTIEWRFHSTDVVIVDHGVPEDRNLCSVIENHLKPGRCSHQLRQFCEEQLDHLKLFIRKYPKGPRSPFIELDVQAPLRQQLSDVVVLEYPVIHVFLHSQSYDFEVDQVSVVPHKSLLKDPVSNEHESVNGVLFREEELEEDSSASDPRVTDLIHVPSSPLHQMPSANGISGEVLNNLDRPLLPKVAADRGSHSRPMTEELLTLDDLDFDFDFDQGLIDAYSDIIAEINPDDFFDMDRILTKEAGVEETNSGGGYFTKEELEEGEIGE